MRFCRRLRAQGPERANLWPLKSIIGAAARLQQQQEKKVETGQAMATDYDAPRKSDEDLGQDSLEELKARRNEKTAGVVDEDEADAAEGFELPGADLSGEELSVRVLPKQADEFMCDVCFLIHHRSQLASEDNDVLVCMECAP